jgi:hypothetical protein
MCQRIRQIIELAAIKELRWHVVLEPKNFGYLHFNAHLPSHISQEIVTGSVDLLGFFHWSVIQPEDDISIIAIIREVRTSDGNWFIGIVGKHGKGTGSVKTNSSNGRRIDVMLIKCPVYTLANTPPYVRSRLLIISLLWLPQSNILGGHFSMLRVKSNEGS